MSTMTTNNVTDKPHQPALVNFPKWSFGIRKLCTTASSHLGLISENFYITMKPGMFFVTLAQKDSK